MKKLFQFLKQIFAAADQFMDAIDPPVEGEPFRWWIKELSTKDNLIRLLKAFDAWLMDLLYPDVGQDDDPWHL